VLKKIALIAVIAYSILLLVVSLASLKNLPDVGVSFGDKIFHCLAYFVLAILWFAAFVFTFSFNKRKAIIYSVCISILFGILIEVLQDTLTDYRALDIYDVFANTLGVAIAVLILTLKGNNSIKI